MSTPLELARQAEQLDEAQWFDFLDELDAVYRRRNARQEEPDPPPGHDRDALAAWMARSHFLADSAVREIWYLPRNAPADEIRLLDVNDRLLGPDLSQVEALKFGLEGTMGVPFWLFVADVSSEELERIKNGALPLPEGWTLDQSTVWRRRG